MRTRIALLSLACVAFVACGIPEEQHNEALNKIKELQSELGQEKTAYADLDKKHKGCLDENRVYKTKLVSLGQDLSKMKSKTGQMSQTLTAKEKQIAQLMKAQEAARKRAALYKNLVAQFKKMIDSGKLRVSLRRGRMVVQLSDKILFASGKAKLKKDGQEALVEVTKILSSMGKRTFQIAGHTDNIPIKSRKFKSNWELSTARAVNVVKFMISNGMDPNHISAAGYGANDPVGDNSTDDGRQLNRRIEITLVPNLDEIPGFSS